jgi:hypothetical protein
MDDLALIPQSSNTHGMPHMPGCSLYKSSVRRSCKGITPLSCWAIPLTCRNGETISVHTENCFDSALSSRPELYFKSRDMHSSRPAGARIDDNVPFTPPTVWSSNIVSGRAIQSQFTLSPHREHFSRLEYVEITVSCVHFGISLYSPAGSADHRFPFVLCGG